MHDARRLVIGTVLGAAFASGCATAGSGRSLDPLPAPPADTTGPLRIDLVYPPVVDTTPVPRTVAPVTARDSTFLFGSLGRGDATLAINGFAVPVFPNGAWLAWVPLPEDTVAAFEIVASAAGTDVRYEFLASLPRSFVPPDSGAWIDTTSFLPTGDRWVRPDEGVRLVVRATPGARVTLTLTDGRHVAFLPERVAESVSWGERAFGTGQPSPEPRQADRYVAWWSGPLGPDPGHVLPLAAPPRNRRHAPAAHGRCQRRYRGDRADRWNRGRTPRTVRDLSLVFSQRYRRSG